VRGGRALPAPSSSGKPRTKSGVNSARPEDPGLEKARSVPAAPTPPGFLGLRAEFAPDLIRGAPAEGRRVGQPGLTEAAFVGGTIRSRSIRRGRGLDRTSPARAPRDRGPHRRKPTHGPHHRRSLGRGALVRTGGPLRHRRHHAGDAARGAGADHRRDRAPHHRARARRSRPAPLGRHRLPPHRDGRDAPLRQARRHPRPAGRPASRHRRVRRRLRGLRLVADHAAARRGARPPGLRRRRAHRARADGHRRRGAAEGTGALPSLHRRHLHGLQPRRAGAGRRHRRAPALVRDLLAQPPPRARGLLDDGLRPAPPAPPRPAAPARPRGRRAPRRRHHGSAARPVLGRHALSLVLGPDRRPPPRLRPSLGRLRLAAPARRRSPHPAGRAPQPRGADGDAVGLLRHGHLHRADHLRPPLLRSGLGADGRRVRLRAGALDGRNRDRGRRRPGGRWLPRRATSGCRWRA
jgi:hypothetical protein